MKHRRKKSPPPLPKLPKRSWNRTPLQVQEPPDDFADSNESLSTVLEEASAAVNELAEQSSAVNSVQENSVQEHKHLSTAFLQARRNSVIVMITNDEAEILSLTMVVEEIKRRRANAQALLKGIDAVIASRGEV